MSYSAKIICDSISETGKRLTTFEITFPRIVLAEFNTHRMFSRNSASSRAIPFQKQLDRVLENPFIPEQFPINGKGMQPNSYIYGNSDVYIEAKDSWLKARDSAIKTAQALYNCLDKFEDSEHKQVKIHKQIVNRLLEPFQWHTVIVTATEFDNFFKLRTNENAQYEIRRIADLMYEAYHAYKNFPSNDGIELKSFRLNKEGNWNTVRPQKLEVEEWHLPLFNLHNEEDIKQLFDYIYNHVSLLRNEGINIGSNEIIATSSESFIKLAKRISVARCARVSYLTHDGKRNIEEDLKLFEKLRISGHWSPFEHIATPHFQDFGTDFGTKEGSYDDDNDNRQFHNERYCNLKSGNFIGWRQYRKEFQDENCTHFRKA